MAAVVDAQPQKARPDTRTNARSAKSGVHVAGGAMMPPPPPKFRDAVSELASTSRDKMKMPGAVPFKRKLRAESAERREEEARTGHDFHATTTAALLSSDSFESSRYEEPLMGGSAPLRSSHSTFGGRRTTAKRSQISHLTHDTKRKQSNGIVFSAGVNGALKASDDLDIAMHAGAPVHRRQRSFTDHTTESLDAEQKEKMTKVMRMIMVMRIKQSDGSPVEIIPGLYIGSIGAALNKVGLLQRGIKHVLCVASNIPLYFPESFNYKQVSVGDRPDQDLFKHFPPCCKFIGRALKAGEGVLVHCFAGISRSATVITAFLMLAKHWTLPQSIDYIRTKRTKAQPNPGFCAQLLKWGRYLESMKEKKRRSGYASSESSNDSSGGSNRSMQSPSQSSPGQIMLKRL